MATSINSYLRVLENVNRTWHSDATGGGTVLRTFYCEPYTAHVPVVTALKGTVRPTAADANVWERVKPHADPILIRKNRATDAKEGYYYVSDVKVVPWAQEAVRGAPPRNFEPSNDLEQQRLNILTALDYTDDFDGPGMIDCPGLNPEEIIDGEPNYNGAEPFTSKGNCGAIIVAAYTPLITVDWPYSARDPFGNEMDPWDWVDPQWTPVYRSTVIGKDLKLVIKELTGSTTLFEGLSDSVTVVETVWEFTCRRRLVPFIPKNTIDRLTSRINFDPVVIGDYSFTDQTVRFENPKPHMMMAPDGQQYFDMDMKLSIRTLHDEYYDLANDDFYKGQITWNQYLALPKGIGGFPSLYRMSYYPVGWKTGYYPVVAGGGYRYLHLLDHSFQWPEAPNAVNLSLTMPFVRGFRSTD